MNESRRPVDVEVWEQELDPWLPGRIYDCHVHVGLAQHARPVSPERLRANWALEVGAAQSWEELRRRHELLFPGRQVSTLAFGGVFKEVDLWANNAYVLAGAAANQARALMVTAPDWEPATIERALDAGFVGIKPYPDLAAGDSTEVSIYDFLPHSHLAALNRRRGVLMLHLPRAGRLADPDNTRELLEIADTYPAVKLIVAHIGRAYCLPTAERGLPPLADRPGIHFDIAAHLNADVFALALGLVGPGRLLFGSDLPITMMRGEREHVGDAYVNYTDEPYSWNRHRKSPEQEARYTFFLYQELRALIAAVRKAGFGQAELAQIMRGNAERLLRPA